MKMLERKGKRVQVIKPNHDVISAHTVRLRRGRKYRNEMQVYFCNIFQAFSFKMTFHKSKSHKESLHLAIIVQCLYKAFSYKETCKNERDTHFTLRCLSSF